MTDFASLNIKIDSSAVPKGTADLDKLTAAGARAEKSVDKLGATAAQTGGQIKGAGRAASDYAAAAQHAATNTGRMGETAGLSRHHVQNLAFQFQDLGIQMVAAANSGAPLRGVLTAFAQQGSQISGIMMQAGIGVSGLVKQLVSGTAAFLAANPAILAVAAVLGVAAAAFGIMTSEINKNAKVQVTWSDTVLGAYDAVKAYLTGAMVKAFEYFGINAEDVWKSVVNVAKWAINWIIGVVSLFSRVAIAAFSTIGPAIGDAFYSGVNLAIRGLNFLIRKTIDAVNFISRAFNVLLPDGMALPKLTAPQIQEVSNSYAGAGAKFGTAMLGALSDTVNRDYLGDAAAYLSPYAQARALKRGESDGAKVGKAHGAAAGKASGKAFEDSFSAEIAAIQEKLMNGVLETMAQSRAMRESADRSDLLDVQEQMRQNTIKRTQGAVDEAEAMARLNAQLRETIDALDQLGGIGSTLGDFGAFVYGSKSGDYSGVRGPAGLLAQNLLTTKNPDGTRSNNEFGRKIEGILTKIFGDNGKFTKLLENAGTGAAIGSILYGRDNKNAQLGGAVGSVAGGALGAAIGGPLGAELGKIIGGVIGSTIGSLFKKSPTGSASVVNGVVTGGGNNADARSATSGIAGSVSGSLASIANQLGGSVGAYGYSVGMRNDYYRVSGSSGADVTSKRAGNLLYDGKDPAEAARIALLNAIQDGAIKGIREGAAALLKAGSDINAQVQKAIKFQGVFDDLKKATDPVGAALDTLTKKFDDLRAIFAEAGASAADYADLERLLSLQRADAIEQGRREAVDKIRGPAELQIRILELLGQSEDALAAARLLELAGIKDTLQPLQSMIYQLEDARKIIDTFQPLADNLKAYRDELLGGGNGDSFGRISAKFRAAAVGAANGDAASLGELRGTASAFLDAAKNNAGSGLEYRRAVSEVLSSVDKGIFAAETQVDYAQLQIDAIKNSANILAQLREEMATLQSQIVVNTGITARMWTRFETDGLPVVTTGDTPLQVQVVT